MAAGHAEAQQRAAALFAMASDQTQKKSLAEVEREQEELLKKKYGQLLKRKPLMLKEHKYWDSADWALAKEGKGEGEQQLAHAQQAAVLPPRTGPAHIAAHRRTSKLDSSTSHMR